MSNTASSDDDQGSTAVDRANRDQQAGARADWERRIYQRLTDTTNADQLLALPAAMAAVLAVAAVRHIRLRWNEVLGAAADASPAG